MDRYIVASVQQRMRLPQSLEELCEQQRRFLRAAQAKNARLVVFPELAGLMLAAPLLGDFRTSLLKRIDRSRSARASTWARLSGRLAGGVASLVKASFEASLHGLLDVEGPRLWETYMQVYGDLAREFGLTLVAPSLFAPDPIDGVVRNMAAVFGPDGSLLGTQAKVMLGALDRQFCQPGGAWSVVRTEAGALGLMLGSDVLYPEVGRALAFQGAEVLVAQGACLSPTLYNKQRAGSLARMQDNQLFAVSAFLVGPSQLQGAETSTFVGKSAIFAPQELTPRFNGVLVEMGSQGSEGVLTAEWDFPALKHLWETSETPLRRNLPLPQVNKLLAALYEQVQGMARLPDGEPAGDEASVTALAAPPARALLTLDDLPLIASVTSRWPLQVAESEHEAAQETAIEWQAPLGGTATAVSATGAPPPVTDYEEETDEMDALAGSGEDKPA